MYSKHILCPFEPVLRNILTDNCLYPRFHLWVKYVKQAAGNFSVGLFFHDDNKRAGCLRYSFSGFEEKICLLTKQKNE